jgi:hypothetical protein
MFLTKTVKISIPKKLKLFPSMGIAFSEAIVNSTWLSSKTINSQYN